MWLGGCRIWFKRTRAGSFECACAGTPEQYTARVERTSNACSRCGYDLGGLPATASLIRCPECGAVSDSAGVRPFSPKRIGVLYLPAAACFALGPVLVLAPAFLVGLSLLGFGATLVILAVLLCYRGAYFLRSKLLIHAPLAGMCALVSPWLSGIVWLRVLENWP